MDRNTLIEQLNEAVDAIIERRDAAPSADATLAGLVSIAEDLAALPRANFKSRLKADLLTVAGTPTYSDLSTDRESGRDSGHQPERGRDAMTTSATQAPALPSVIPYLTCRNAAAAIDFYKQAFGAVETMRLTEPSGRIGHAEMTIGNLSIMLAEEYPEYGFVGPQSIGGSSVRIHLYLDDVDQVAAGAVAAGAKLIRPISDEFYGDRTGLVEDPFGHIWVLATRKEDVSISEMQRRFDALMGAGAEPQVKPIPEGFHTITPYLQVDGAARLLEFVTEAFDAREALTVPMPDGSIMHAEVKVGDSMIELADAGGPHKAMPAALHLYVDDADATYERAVRAGGISVMAPTDQFYGDREACVKDPAGNSWYIATHKLTGKPIPEGFRSITPFFHPRGVDTFIGFLERAFGAEVAGRHAMPDGTVAHATVKIGDSYLEMGEAHGDWGPMPTAIHLYVEDADALYKSAIDAGATSMFAPRDEPYGDRVGGVTDPFDNVWYVATRKKIVSFKPATTADQPEPARTRVREGFGTVTPYITVREAAGLIDFAKQVFDAEEAFRAVAPGGGVHCELKIGDTMLMMGGGAAWTGAPRLNALHVYVPDIDAVYQRAVDAGATTLRPPSDKFYGERSAAVRDPFGNNWYIATHQQGQGYIPAGLGNVIACLHPLRAEPVIGFMKKAFGAVEESRAQSPDGVIHHAVVRVGDTAIEMGEAHEEFQPMSTQFLLYVPNVDELYKQAIEAGAASISEPQDQPYGDRTGAVTDPFGNHWYIATPIRQAT